MSDLLIYDKELDIYVNRFSCDCGNPNHIIDLTFDIGNQQVYVDFSDGFITDTFLGKIKLAFEILFSKKKRIANRELIIRNEDIKNLQQVFIEAEKWFEKPVDKSAEK